MKNWKNASGNWRNSQKAAGTANIVSENISLLHGRKLLPLPLTKLYQRKQSFHAASPDIEVNVRMMNINHGHNKKLLSACRPLEEYAWFVKQARKNLSAYKNSKPSVTSDAIDKAIDEMPEDFQIKKFITANRAEVKDMCLTEYNKTKLWK